MTVKSVEVEPEMTLSEWLIVVPDDTKHMHFAGRKSDGLARLSSPIVSFDLGSMTGRTASGRVYRLVGGRARSGLFLRVLVAKSWGTDMVDRVKSVAPEMAAVHMPAAGMS